MPLADEDEKWFDALDRATGVEEEDLRRPPVQICKHCGTRMAYDRVNCLRTCMNCGYCFNFQRFDHDIVWSDYKNTHRFPRPRKNYHRAKRLNEKLQACKCMTPRQRSIIEDLFAENEWLIRKAHDRHGRININYNFIIHQFCELLGFKSCLGHFPSNSSPKVLERSLMVWDKIKKKLSFRTLII